MARLWKLRAEEEEGGREEREARTEQISSPRTTPCFASGETDERKKMIKKGLAPQLEFGTTLFSGLNG